jgi:hypothetical protein
MTRSRLVLIASATIVALGVVAGLGALYFDSARAAVGPLPGEGLALPADTQFVMGFDVKRLVASPVWERYAERRSMRPEALQRLESWTGLDPARDIDQIVVAGRGRQGKTLPPPLVMAMGRFDLEKLGLTLDKAEDGSTSQLQGVTLFSMEKKGVSSTLALLDAGTLLFGPTERVKAVVASRSKGETPLRQNTTLLGLVESVKPGATFWMVGDESLLAGMPKGIPAPGMGGADAMASMNLPPLRSLVLTGDLGPQLSLSLTGVAADEEAATKLADVVRGFVALMSLQAQQKPELAELASAFNISTETNKVLINARIPYELLEALQPKKKEPPAEAEPGTDEAEQTDASAEATPE